MGIVDVIISARWVLPMSPEGPKVLENHAVVMNAGKVVAIVPNAEVDNLYDARDRLDRPTHVLMPGLINSHTHTGMTLMRGCADDQNLMKWLQDTVWPVETAFVAQSGFCGEGAMLAISEMVRGGVTTFADMYWFPEATAEAVIKTGVRAVLGMIIIMFPSAYASSPDEYIEKGHALRDKYADQTRLHFAYAPHSPYTVPDAVWEKLRDLSEKNGTLIHTHLHETKDECDASLTLDRSNPACHQSEQKCRPIANFARLGLLSPRLLAVHMTQLDDEEIAMVAENRVGVAHCPTSNAKLGSGFCPIEKLDAAGVSVGLGTDSAASNNSLDVFGEMKLAALVAKNVAGDATVVPAYSAIKMATLGGAKALGIGEVTGSLEIGKAADVISVEMATHCRNSPVFDICSALVYAASRNDVFDVFVEGKPVVRDGKFETIDEADVVSKANKWGLEIAEMLAKKKAKEESA